MPRNMSVRIYIYIKYRERLDSKIVQSVSLYKQTMQWNSDSKSKNARMNETESKPLRAPKNLTNTQKHTHMIIYVKKSINHLCKNSSNMSKNLNPSIWHDSHGGIPPHLQPPKVGDLCFGTFRGCTDTVDVDKTERIIIVLHPTNNSWDDGKLNIDYTYFILFYLINWRMSKIKQQCV